MGSTDERDADESSTSMPVLPITSHRTLAACRAMPLQPGDVFIASYPKSGTTWMQNILTTLLLGAPEFDHVSSYAPFFEIDPHWHDDGRFREPAGFEATCRRMFNTHLLFDMLPQATNARYVYLVRDGRDAATSFYHHLHNQAGAAGGFDGSFEEFEAQWAAGQLPYGRWVDHIKAWDAAAGDSRVLFVRYEDLVADPRPQVLRIVQHCNLQVDEEAIDRCMPYFTLDYMKAHLARYQPISVEWRNDFRFIRKGTVGDHTSLFNAVMLGRFHQAVNDVFPHGLPTWASPAAELSS